MSPNLSIIVPIYKSEIYLEKCINSILNQTYQDFELILIDDGSPDGCGVICDEYSRKDIRIKVIHQENYGISTARNAGLDIARGAVVGFVDSDDYIAPDMYAVLISNLEYYEADISQCRFRKVSSQKESNLPNKDHSCKVYTTIEALNNLYNAKYLNTVVLWNKVYKACLFAAERFPDGKFHEDEFTLYKVIYKASKIVDDSRALYYYYQSEQSIMRRGFETKHLDGLEAARQRMDFFDSHNLYGLLLKSRRQYLSLLIFYSARIIVEKKPHADIIKSLRQEIDKLFLDLAHDRALSVKNWVQFVSFRTSPTLYSVMFKLRGKLGR